MEKDGRLVAIIECKEVQSEKPTTFHTQMRLAFAELSDLHRKYKEAKTIVFVPADVFLERAEKYVLAVSRIAKWKVVATYTIIAWAGSVIFGMMTKTYTTLIQMSLLLNFLFLFKQEN